MMLIHVVFLLICAKGSLLEDVKYLKTSEIPELAYMNTSVDPCENFYEYTCGNFKNVNPRPEKFASWDSFIIHQEKLHDEISEILSSKLLDTDSESLQKSKTAYQACINTDYADKLNYPEAQIIKSLGPWPLISNNGEKSKFSWRELGNLIAFYGIPLFFSIEVTNDLFNSSQLVILIGKDPVKNPSLTPEIEDNSVDFLKFRLKYTAKEEIHPFQLFLNEIAVILRDAINSQKSDSEIAAEIPDIINFMNLVQIGGNDTGGFGSVSQYFSIDELQKWIDENLGDGLNLDILEYLNRVFAKSGFDVKPNSRVLISSLASFYGTLNLIKKTSDDMLQNFIFSRLFTYTSPDSNNDMRKAYEQFRLRMEDRIFTRSEYCTRVVLGYPNSVALSMAATHEYQKQKYNDQKHKSITTMINNLNSAFINILDEAEWLDESTRKTAKLKLDNMITLLGFPEFVRTELMVNYYYCNVRICGWDHFGNAQRLRAFGNALNYALLHKERDRQIWNRSPLVVNAFYNSQNNRILLPISMLNSVFFNGNVSAVDYGRIGSTIGHEMTHGFDSQGYLYDETGSLNPWWSQNTTIEFKQREQCFVSQYEKYYIPEIDQYVNSKTSVRENIADNGGLRESYKAFKTLLQNQSVLSVKHMTLDQLFFISYGTMWCAQETNEYLEKLQTQSYAPNRFRVIGSVSNNHEFSKAFNCPVGSKMNPIDKCILW